MNDETFVDQFHISNAKTTLLSRLTRAWFVCEGVFSTALLHVFQLRSMFLAKQFQLHALSSREKMVEL